MTRDSRSKPGGRKPLAGSVHESGGARSAIAIGLATYTVDGQRYLFINREEKPHEQG